MTHAHLDGRHGLDNHPDSWESFRNERHMDVLSGRSSKDSISSYDYDKLKERRQFTSGTADFAVGPIDLIIGGGAGVVVARGIVAGGSSVASVFASSTSRVPTKEAAGLIKAGSSGGPTAGKAFPKAIKDAAKAENPMKVCVYCSRKGTATQVDHVIPKARGGNATLDNAQLACPHCNASKGAIDFPVNPPPNYFGKWPPSHWGN